MIRPAFYFEVTSPRPEDWVAERRAYDQFQADWFEVLMEYPYRLDDLPAGGLETLRQVLSGTTLSYHGATLNLSLVALSAAIVEESIQILCDQTIAARALGCRLFTFHAGEHPYFFERAAGPLAQALAGTLGPLLRAAAAAGCELCIENLKNKYTYPRTIGELDAVFSACPDLRLALDVRHACTVGEDPIEMARVFATQLRSVHFRADCGLTQQQAGEFVDVLRRSSFDGPFVVEDPSLNVLDKSRRPMLLEAQRLLAPFLEI